MIKSLIAISVLALLPSIGFSYQTTLNSSLYHSNYNSGDFSGASLGISHSLIEIKNSEGPPALAYFLNKQSNLTISHSEHQQIDGTSNVLSHTYLTGIYILNKIEISGYYSTQNIFENNSSENWSLGLGYYLSDKERLSSTLLSEGEVSDFNVSYFGVHQTANRNYYSITGNFNYKDEHGAKHYYISSYATYYSTHNLSHTISPSIGYFDPDAEYLSNSTSYSLAYFTEFFIKSDLSTKLRLDYSDAENTNPIKGVSLSISKRF